MTLQKSPGADHYWLVCLVKVRPYYEKPQQEDTKNKRKRLSSLQKLHAFRLTKKYVWSWFLYLNKFIMELEKTRTCWRKNKGSSFWKSKSKGGVLGVCYFIDSKVRRSLSCTQRTFFWVRPGGPKTSSCLLCPQAFLWKASLCVLWHYHPAKSSRPGICQR